VNDEKYEMVKGKLKKRILLDWTSMRCLKTVKERTVLLDVIDMFRANVEYLWIHKELKMDQRVLKIET
jgi:capsid portal protein